MSCGSAIIEARRRRPVGAFLLAVLAGSCARIEMGEVPAAPTIPTIRVGLAVDVRSVEFGGGEALDVRTDDGRTVLRVPAGRTVRVERGDGSTILVPRDGDRVAVEHLTVLPDEGEGVVRVNGRDYRGVISVLSGDRGMTVVNAVHIDSYLAGVVNAEMGRRGTREQAALTAQAVVSRTVAVRALGRSRVRGYDVVATVQDQAYGGVGAELDQGRQAVEGTRGEVLMYGGVVIDAFFSSTCGGRTAAGGEVFAGAAGHAYLPSQSDVDPSGTPWCVISPRFTWTESWTGEALAGTLRETLPNGRGAHLRPEHLLDVVVRERTGSGRVSRLQLVLTGGAEEADARTVRQVLRPAGGGLLRSSAFRLQSTRRGDRLVSLVAEGGGAGHGVGLCQWGAVGRARTGVGYREILSAYFPGTTVQRLW